jgi:hypothetical protein
MTRPKYELCTSRTEVQRVTATPTSSSYPASPLDSPSLPSPFLLSPPIPHFLPSTTLFLFFPCSPTPPFRHPFFLSFCSYSIRFISFLFNALAQRTVRTGPERLQHTYKLENEIEKDCVAWNITILRDRQHNTKLSMSSDGQKRKYPTNSSEGFIIENRNASSST